MQSTIASTHLEGAGAPVVLVHGIGHRRQAWGQVPQRLAERGYDVHVVDLPGHGESPTPTRPDGYSMRSSAEQLERFFADRGIARPHVVGNSLGGAMVLELAKRGSVASATALSPAGFFPVLHLPNIAVNLLFMKGGSHLPEALHRRLNGYAWFRKIAFRALYTHPEKVSADDAVGDTLNLRRAKGFWPHFVRATFLRVRGDLTSPTTIAWGDSDRLLLPSEARTAKERFPEATHVDLPDCGHCPQVDHPDLVVDTVVATIERAGASAGGQAPAAV